MDSPTGPANSGDKTLRELREEAYRLHEKLEQAIDPDVKSGLQLKYDLVTKQIAELTPAKKPAEVPPDAMAAIQSRITDDETARFAKQILGDQVDIVAERLTPKVVEEEEVEEETPEPATPEQTAEAENLLRRSRLAKTRGNTAEAMSLLEQAIKTAPGSAAILEAVGDDYAERKRWSKAISSYKKAMQLAPQNVALERKHAETILNSQIGTFSSMQAEESAASAGSATIISVILPGVGHIVLGRVTTGVAILAVWGSMLLWLLLRKSDLEGLMGNAVGRHGTGSSTILIPIFVGLLVHIGAIADCASRAKGARRRRPPSNRPPPPVDLPFE